jgi:hypothetical protein
MQSNFPLFIAIFPSHCFKVTYRGTEKKLGSGCSCSTNNLIGDLGKTSGQNQLELSFLPHRWTALLVIVRSVSLLVLAVLDNTKWSGLGY